MKTRYARALWVVLGIVLSGQACQSQELPAQIQRYETLTSQHPADGGNWYQLAVLDQDAGRYTEAEVAYR